MLKERYLKRIKTWDRLYAYNKQDEQWKRAVKNIILLHAQKKK